MTDFDLENVKHRIIVHSFATFRYHVRNNLILVANKYALFAKWDSIFLYAAILDFAMSIVYCKDVTCIHLLKRGKSECNMIILI